jgi:hypothetical protein
MNVIRSSTSSIAALNMAENAVLEELRRQSAGLTFLSRAWLVCVFREGVNPPVGYPKDPRTLDQYLRKLEAYGEIHHLRAYDGGAYYSLKDTWDAVLPAALDGLRRSSLEGRGSPKTISILLPGPAALKPEVRPRLWTSIHSTDTAGPSLVYQSFPIHNLRDPVTGVLVPRTHLRVGEGVNWAVLVISSERPRGGKVRIEWSDDAGRLIHSGFLRGGPGATPS